MTAAVLAVVLAAGPRVTVDVLAREAPRSLVVRGGGAVRSVAARGDALFVDGRAVPALALPPGAWRVEVPGARPRVYEGGLALRAEAGTVRVRAELDLEPYVAGVVASEALPGTPPAALEALAIVVRSYALAARDRHADAALCDLAHCQLLRADRAGARQRAAAARAARTTAGEVLVLPSREIATATFHASCGGHTADPREVFGAAESGGAPGPDPGCVGPQWSARLTPESMATAIRGALATADPARTAAVPPALRAADVVLLRGAGGWIARVEAPDGSWDLSGDAFARALDAAVGRGRIRSARLALADEGGRVAVRGTGHGHGVGLCQAGAARWARQGEGRAAILARYFPGVEIQRRFPRQGPRHGRCGRWSRCGRRTAAQVPRSVLATHRWAGRGCVVRSPRAAWPPSSRNTSRSSRPTPAPASSSSSPAPLSTGGRAPAPSRSAGGGSSTIRARSSAG